MLLSYSVPSAWQALPTLAGLAQSFFRSQLWCPFFQEASPEPLGGRTDSLWVSQCPEQPLTQTVHGGGSRAAGGGRSSVDAGEREHPPAAQRPGQDTQPQEERSKEHHPSRPPGHLPAPLFQPREISPSGTEGGDVPDGATSTPVSETMEAGSPWLVPCSRSQTWPWACRLSPSEHTFGLHDAKGRGPPHGWGTGPHASPGAGASLSRLRGRARPANHPCRRSWTGPRPIPRHWTEGDRQRGLLGPQLRGSTGS